MTALTIGLCLVLAMWALLYGILHSIPHTDDAAKARALDAANRERVT